jgi:hypothetical protein
MVSTLDNVFCLPYATANCLGISQIHSPEMFMTNRNCYNSYAASTHIEANKRLSLKYLQGTNTPAGFVTALVTKKIFYNTDA